MITMKNVSKWYGQFQVLTDCSTHVNKGDVMVICGPSGSGQIDLNQNRERTGTVSAGRDCGRWCLGRGQEYPFADPARPDWYGVPEF